MQTSVYARYNRNPILFKGKFLTDALSEKAYEKRTEIINLADKDPENSVVGALPDSWTKLNNPKKIFVAFAEATKILRTNNFSSQESNRESASRIINEGFKESSQAVNFSY